MYKVLIVEDEELERSAIKSILENNYGSLFEIRTANDGMEACDISMDFGPDIILMDVQMANMSGLEASRLILENQIDTRIIMLTAYDYFDYAQTSINIGVKDYLLKPIKSNKLFETINKQLDEIEKQKTVLNEMTNAKENIEKLRPMLKDYIMEKIIDGDFERDEINEYLKMLSINFRNASVIVMEIMAPGQVNQNIGMAIIKNKIIEIILNDKRFENCILSNHGSSRYIPGMLCNGIRQESETVFENKMEQIGYLNELYKEIYNALYVKVKIGISDVVHDFEGLHQCYRQGMFAVNHGREDINYYSDISDNRNEEAYPSNIEKEILGDMFIEIRDRLKDSFGRFTSCMMEREVEQAGLLKNSMLRLAMSVIRNVSDRLMTPYQLYDEYLLEGLVKSNDAADIKSYAWELLKDIHSKIISSFQNKNAHVIEKTKEYITANYTSDITLNDISRHSNISPFHLSRLFKRETGSNIFDFLSMVRIEKSKEILAGSDTSVKEICFLVGYSDPNYYCKAFKKVVGITPTAYRDINRKNQ